MNIFSLRIYIKSKEQQANMEEQSLCKIKANSYKSDTYDQYVKSEWNKIKESNVRFYILRIQLKQ
jgi:hypothetical protein